MAIPTPEPLSVNQLTTLDLFDDLTVVSPLIEVGRGSNPRVLSRARIIDFWAETGHFFLGLDSARKSRAIEATQLRF